MAFKRPWHGYITCSLTKKQNGEVKALAGNVDAIIDALGSSTVGGVKYSVTWDAYNDCYVATVLGHNHADNEGFAISARSKDLLTALAGVVYKHTVIFASGKWEKKTLDDLID